jgi:hypothetical protein
MRRKLLLPIWVRVSGIIALILAGTVVSSLLLGSAVSRGENDGGRQIPGMQMPGTGQHGTGGASGTPMPSQVPGQHTGSDRGQGH